MRDTIPLQLPARAPARTPPPRLAIDSDELTVLADRALTDSFDVAGHRDQIEQLGLAVFDLQHRIRELTSQLVSAREVAHDAIATNAILVRDLAAADLEIGRQAIRQAQRDTAQANTAALQVRLQQLTVTVTGMTYEAALARIAVDEREFRSEERRQLDAMARGTQPLGFVVTDVPDRMVIDDGHDAPLTDLFGRALTKREIERPLMSETVGGMA